MREPTRASAALWRPVAFFVLMIGFGLRLDTTWQGVAWTLILLGGMAAAAALRPLLTRSSEPAFVPPESKR